MSSVFTIILKSALMMSSTQLVIWAQSAKHRKAQSARRKVSSGKLQNCAKRKAQIAQRKAQSAKCKAQTAD